MFKAGDIIRSPWGRGVVLRSDGGEVYILWSGFGAHGRASAWLRIEQSFEGDDALEWYAKEGEIDISNALTALGVLAVTEDCDGGKTKKTN